MNISACKNCYNCGLCYNICPYQAITVDDTGTFYTPVVDERKCTDCGLCYSRCPSNNALPALDPIAAYAGWHRDTDVLLSSSSGGVFLGLAESILSEGGVVFGAVYTEDCSEVVFASTEESELALMQKSKYVESLVGFTFKRVKSYLNQGRKVLFCGTPCQCAGLRSFLDQNYANLISCDFACGGLPSHRIYQAHLSALEQKFNSKISSIDFRPKTHGWRRYAILVKFENGKIYNRLGTEDPYLRCFLYGKHTVRHDCLSCKFSNCHQSDLTIADFWLNEKCPSLVNPDGVSLILCNTEKGKNAIGKIQDHYHFDELDVAEVAYNNKETITTRYDRDRHNAFIKMFEEQGFASTYKQLYPFSCKKAFKNWLCRVTKRRRR